MFNKLSLSSPNRTTEKQKQTNYYTPGALQLYTPSKSPAKFLSDFPSSSTCNQRNRHDVSTHFKDLK